MMINKIKSYRYIKQGDIRNDRSSWTKNAKGEWKSWEK